MKPGTFSLIPLPYSPVFYKILDPDEEVFRNLVGKGENAGNITIFLIPGFQKASFSRSLKDGTGL